MMFYATQTQKKERISPIPFAHSHLFIKFASILRHSGGKEGLYRRGVYCDYLYRLNSRKIPFRVKMITIAPHHWYVAAIIGYLHILWCGLLIIHSKGNARSLILG